HNTTKRVKHHQPSLPTSQHDNEIHKPRRQPPTSNQAQDTKRPTLTTSTQPEPTNTTAIPTTRRPATEPNQQPTHSKPQRSTQHTAAPKHKTPNGPHSQPARRQNQPTDPRSQQHEVQKLNRINSLPTPDHKSQPNPEPGTVYKNFQNQQPCLNAPVPGTP